MKLLLGEHSVPSDTFEILLTLAGEHGLTDVHVLSDEELSKLPTQHGQPIEAVAGNLDIGGTVVSVTVAPKLGFPFALPLVFMKPWDAFGVIPHVGEDGYVCFIHDEGLIIDANRWQAVVSESLQKALAQLRAGASGQNIKDFADEFQTYWNRQEGIVSVESLVAPTDEPKIVQVFLKEFSYAYVCDKEADLIRYRSGRPINHLTQRNALYVPLPVGAVLVPPHPCRSWTPEQATKAIVNYLDSPTKKKISKLSRKLDKTKEFVIVYLPRPDGDGGTLFGLDFTGIGDTHPLVEGPTPTSVSPFGLVRHDRAYVQPRGGGRLELHNKNVLLIGCGSIGGFLALELARAGIGRFTLIDHESLSVENVFRHALGMKYLDKKKGAALKDYMVQNIPYLDIEAVDMRIEEAIANGKLDLTSFDIAVVALGYPPIELHLNRLSRESKTAFPPLVFVWVEAYGIGGHVLVSNNRQSDTARNGCLECLYTPLPGDRDGLHCRASFAKAGQDFGRNLSGCSGLFTPYGSTTAVRAALLATETVVDVLLGREKGNPLLSFKGCSAEFETQDYELTDRYKKMSEDDLHSYRYDYVNSACPVCGGKL